MKQNYSFLKLRYVKSWTWKFKVKVKGGVKCQGHKVSPTSYWFIFLLLHSNQTTHSWKRLFQNLPLKIQGQGHGGVKGQDPIMDPTLSQFMSLCFMPIRPSIPEIRLDIQSRPGHDVLSHEIKKYLVKFKFWIFKNKLKYVTHFMKLVGKIWKYEMDWLVSWKIQANMVCPQMIGQTEGWVERLTDKVKPLYIRPPQPPPPNLLKQEGIMKFTDAYMHHLASTS